MKLPEKNMFRSSRCLPGCEESAGSLDWTCYESEEQAMGPIAVETFDHGRAIFLDLDMGLKFTSILQRF